MAAPQIERYKSWSKWLVIGALVLVSALIGTVAYVYVRSTGANQPQIGPDQRQWNEAQRLIESHDYDGAENILKQMLESPRYKSDELKSATILEQLAVCYSNQNKPEAEDCLRQAIHLYDKQIVQTTDRSTPEIIAAIERRFSSAVRLAVMLDNKHKLDAADVAFADAAKIGTGYAIPMEEKCRFYATYAVFLTERGQAEQAMHYEALSLRYPSACRERGYLYEKKRAYDKARIAFEAAVQLAEKKHDFDESSDAYMMLAICALAKNDTYTATKMLAQGLLAAEQVAKPPQKSVRHCDIYAVSAAVEAVEGKDFTKSLKQATDIDCAQACLAIMHSIMALNDKPGYKSLEPLVTQLLKLAASSTPTAQAAINETAHMYYAAPRKTRAASKKYLDKTYQILATWKGAETPISLQLTKDLASQLLSVHDYARAKPLLQNIKREYERRGNTESAAAVQRKIETCDHPERSLPD